MVDEFVFGNDSRGNGGDHAIAGGCAELAVALVDGREERIGRVADAFQIVDSGQKDVFAWRYAVAAQGVADAEGRQIRRNDQLVLEQFFQILLCIAHAVMAVNQRTVVGRFHEIMDDEIQWAAHHFKRMADFFIFDATFGGIDVPDIEDLASKVHGNAAEELHIGGDVVLLDGRNIEQSWRRGDAHGDDRAVHAMDNFRDAGGQQRTADEIAVRLAGQEVVRQHALLVFCVFQRENECRQRIALILNGDSQGLQIFRICRQRTVMDKRAGDQGDFLRLAAGESAGGGARTVVVFIADGENPLAHLFADERGSLRIQGAGDRRAVDARELGDAVYGQRSLHEIAVESNDFVQLLA